MAEAKLVEDMSDDTVMRMYNEWSLPQTAVEHVGQDIVEETMPYLGGKTFGGQDFFNVPHEISSSACSASDSKSELKSLVFDSCLDDLESLLSRAENFVVEEKDSQDFEQLCRQNYAKSLEEAGMDPSDVNDALHEVAVTGDFDVSGVSRLFQGQAFQRDGTQQLSHLEGV